MRIALAAGLGAAPVGVSASTPATWSSLGVPGGLEALLDVVGIDRPVEPARAVLEIVRRVYDPPQRSGLSTDGLQRAVDAHLRAAARAGAPAETWPDVVPLPLGAEFWRQVVVGPAVPDEVLLRALLTDRRASLFYAGLVTLDEPTLRFLSQHRDVAATVARDHAAAFAAFGRAIRVRDGRIVVPGDDGAADVWAHAVGVPPHDAPRFITALLARSNGRVAYLFDSLTWLDVGPQRFALGLAILDPAERARRFDALLTAVVASSRSWNIAAQPFARPLFDAIPLLQELLVSEDGQLAPRLGRRLSSLIVSSIDLPRDAEREIGGTVADEPADAAWLASLLAHPNTDVRLRRRDALLFAQRLVAADADARTADVLVAARATGLYRLAMLTLERMGMRDASTYAEVARTAAALSRPGDSRRTLTRLAQYQGALTAVERARFAHSIEADTATALVRSLSRLAFPGGRYDGAVAAWIAGELVPVLDRAMPEADESAAHGAETTLLRAWAGCRQGSLHPIVRWEGAAYRLDRCATESARLRRLRAAQRGTPLDAALSAHALLERVRGASDARGDTALAEALAGLAAELAPAVTPHRDDEAVREAVARLATAASALEREGTTSGRARARHATLLAEAVDLLVADSLTGLVYASALGDPGGRLARAPSLARRHDYGLRADTAEARVSTPWQLATEDRREGRPLSVRGSLLALDVALAGESLWRLSLAPPPRSPRLAAVQNAGFAETVALMIPGELTDDARDAIGTTMRRGRERLASVLASPRVDEVATGARLTGWRRSVLPWVVAVDAGRAAALVAPREIFELGRHRADAGWPAGLDAWGAPAPALTGCLCLRFPMEPGWERDTGRPASGAMAARSADAALLVAEFLHERGLPASLARDILAGLMQQLVDAAPALHFDDWFSVVHQMNRTTAEDLEDFVAAIAARGPLVPVAGGQANDR